MEAVRENSEFDFDSDLGKVTVRDLDHFPREIFDFAEQVKFLDMSTVQIASLPDDLGRLKNLQVAFFSNNKELEEFPQVLAACDKLETVGMRSCNISNIPERAFPASLRALILTDNHIPELPRSIGDCINLQKLTMTGNRLQSLPQELLRCRNLEIVRFAVNDMASSPDWLLELPHLSWYADASNPYSQRLGQDVIHEIPWDDITIGDEIGRSVNNVIHHARLKDGRDVAVKFFGNKLITDGNSLDDMQACLRSGDHPNVIGGLGKLTTPDGQEALVMPLIPGNFKNLGKPPSLWSICRDTYSNGQTFSADYVYRTAQTTAAGMHHLHTQGVMHGDLYAHNILTNERGESYVGDFGAASLYSVGTKGGNLRERVDVHAFGILLNELTSRCTPSSEEKASIARLNQLVQSCLREETLARPSFAEIVDSLS